MKWVNQPASHRSQSKYLKTRMNTLRNIEGMVDLEMRINYIVVCRLCQVEWGVQTGDPDAAWICPVCSKTGTQLPF